MAFASLSKLVGPYTWFDLCDAPESPAQWHLGCLVLLSKSRSFQRNDNPR
jgi:hypothetical protein